MPYNIPTPMHRAIAATAVKTAIMTSRACCFSMFVRWGRAASTARRSQLISRRRGRLAIGLLAGLDCGGQVVLVLQNGLLAALQRVGGGSFDVLRLFLDVGASFLRFTAKEFARLGS